MTKVVLWKDPLSQLLPLPKSLGSIFTKIGMTMTCALLCDSKKVSLGLYIYIYVNISTLKWNHVHALFLSVFLVGVVAETNIGKGNATFCLP
jgi:hypothetical protein